MKHLCVLCGFAECCVWRTGQSGPGVLSQPLLLDRQLHRGAFEERGKGRAGVSEGLNTGSHTGFRSGLEPFTGARRAQSLFFKLLGLKVDLSSLSTCLQQRVTEVRTSTVGVIM